MANIGKRNMTDNIGSERLKSIPEFAAYLGVSVRTFYRMIERGQVEAVKLGKFTKITPEAQRKCIDNLPRCSYQRGRLQPVDS